MPEKEEIKNQISPRQPMQLSPQINNFMLKLKPNGELTITPLNKAVTKASAILDKTLTGKTCKVMARVTREDVVLDNDGNGSIQILSLVKPKINMRVCTSFD